MHSVRPTIREVADAAHVVREQFEARSCDPVWLNTLYEEAYGVDADGISFELLLRQFPYATCDLASLALQATLGQGELVRASYGGERHTFLSVDTRERSDVIADITADQFAFGPAIYVGKLIAPWSWDYVPTPTYIPGTLTNL